jgi:hypothetical protein
MGADGDIVPCESCGTPTTFATEIAPLGAEPGHRIYQCPTCQRFTWIDWWRSGRSAPPPVQPVPQQQQQQQPQSQQRQSGAKSGEDS